MSYYLPFRKRLKNLRTFLERKVEVEETSDPDARANFGCFLQFLKNLSKQCEFFLHCINIESKCGEGGVVLFIQIEPSYRAFFTDIYMLTLKAKNSWFDCFTLVNFRGLDSVKIYTFNRLKISKISHGLLILSCTDSGGKNTEMLFKVADFRNFLDLEAVGLVSNQLKDRLKKMTKVTTCWSYDETRRVLYRFALCFDQEQETSPTVFEFLQLD